MRRFLILFGVVALLVGFKAEGSLEVLGERFPNAEYVFYLQAGEVAVSIEDAQSVRKQLRGIQGEAVKLAASDFDAVLEFLDGVIFREEYVGGSRVFYGYSKYLGNAVILGGDKINFQIAIVDKSLIVGSPLIAGSY